MKGLILGLTAALVVVGCGGGDDGSGDGDGGFTPIAYDCSVFPPTASSPYILPWHVGQTYGANPHAARETSVQMYALDLALPLGTEIVASRGGVVVRVEERYVDGDNVFGHENYILVQHDDGTVARYIHLTQNGARPHVGDVVNQGDAIGNSGNTGNATGPHLHFDVTEGCCAVAPDYNELPFGRTRPLNFRNAAAGSGNLECGLRRDVMYTALPW